MWFVPSLTTWVHRQGPNVIKRTQYKLSNDVYRMQNIPVNSSCLYFLLINDFIDHLFILLHWNTTIYTVPSPIIRHQLCGTNAGFIWLDNSIRIGI